MTDAARVPTVQGHAATIPEYLVSLALESLELEYFFQYIPYGLIGIRGTPVIDFLVHLPPQWVPLEYDGNIWHTGQYSQSDERFQRALVAQFFNVPEVLVITGDEVDSDTPLDKVIQVVRGKLKI